MNRVIITSMYANPIHPGHVECLEQSKQLGDYLIVIVNNDDVVIRRATNGWIAYKISLFEPEHVVTLVYEDDGSPMGEAEAFARMIREVFPDMAQSKKRGGVSLEVKEHGYSYTDDGGNTPERIDEQIGWLESMVEEK